MLKLHYGTVQYNIMLSMNLKKLQGGAKLSKHE